MHKVTKITIILALIGIALGVYYLIANPGEVSASEISWPLILGAAIIDSINPCAIIVMIMLVGVLSVQQNTARTFLIGAIYVITVYATYLLAGLGLLAGVQALGIAEIVFMIAALLAIGFGVLNLKDFFLPNAGYCLEIPMDCRPKMQQMIKDVSIPGAFLLGFFVSLVELPCSGTVYFTILGMLGHSATFTEALMYLGVYNLIFVLPLALILLASSRLTAEKAQEFRQGNLYRYIRLAMGLLLISLGTGMLLGWF